MEWSPPTNQNGDQKFWLIFEQAAVGIALVSLDGHYLRANPQLCHLLGYSEDELKGQAFSLVTHPDDIQIEVEQGERCLRGEVSTYRTEKRYIRRDGRVITALRSVSLVRDAGGNPDYFISVVQDITTLKIAQEQLREARDRYAVICDNVADLISVHDLAGVYLFASASCAKLLGYTPAELLGTEAFSYFHPDDLDRVRQVYRQHLTEANENTSVRHRVRRKDGAYIWVETYARSIAGTHGLPRELLCVSRDVQEQHDIHLTLLEEKKQAEERNLALEELALQDELTGLKNRRAIEDYLTNKLSSRRASGYPLGCLLVDVDHFKRINDTYGHAMGDDALRVVAKILVSATRGADFLGRYGGDEFIVVLPYTDAAGTVVVGERLIEDVRAAYWPDLPLQERITISIGAACLAQPTNISSRELLGMIDRQLYEAKQAGRDRMVMNTRRTARQLAVEY